MQREAEAQGISIQKFNKDTRFLTNRHRNLKRNDEGSDAKVRDLVEESCKTLKRISLDQLPTSWQSLNDVRSQFKRRN